MLVLARADAGGYPLRPVTLYLDELVASAVRRWMFSPPSARHRASVVSAREFRLPGDEHLLKRMLVNLGQNAVQHTQSGGASRSASSNRSAIAIDVTDEGSGIAAEDRDRIFDRFVPTRPGTSRIRKRPGTARSRGGFAEAHGGSLTLHRAARPEPPSASSCLRLSWVVQSYDAGDIIAFIWRSFADTYT
jgi:two-component system OmpR family sensor kinase